VDIRIDAGSEVPISEQLREQIIFLIGRGVLVAGDKLPSVRALGRRLNVHFNTVSHAYQDLERRGWLSTRRGGGVFVQPIRVPRNRRRKLEDLDDFIDHIIHLASERGVCLQRLRVRVRDRLMMEPPDHLLVVAPEKALGELMVEEIRQSTGQILAEFPIADLQKNVGLAIGAKLLMPIYLTADVERILPRPRPLVPLTYSPVDDHLAAIRTLSQPSTVGVISVSPLFLQTARGLLAQAIGKRHSFHEFLLKLPDEGSARCETSPIPDAAKDRFPSCVVTRWAAPDRRCRNETQDASQDPDVGDASGLRGIDLLFCDSIAFPIIEHSHRILYRLIGEISLQAVMAAMKGLVRKHGGLGSAAKLLSP
jgi:DNA-binding transcriptional regulator YhcF (GntR family)